MKSLEHLTEQQKKAAEPLIENYLSVIESKTLIADAIQAEISESKSTISERMSELQNKLQDAMKAHVEIVKQCKKHGLRVLDHGIQFPVLPYVDQQELSDTTMANLGEYGRAIPLPNSVGQIGSILVLIEEDDIDNLSDKLKALGYLDSDLTIFDNNNPVQTPLLAGISAA